MHVSKVQYLMPQTLPVFRKEPSGNRKSGYLDFHFVDAVDILSDSVDSYTSCICRLLQHPTFVIFLGNPECIRKSSCKNDATAEIVSGGLVVVSE